MSVAETMAQVAASRELRARIAATFGLDDTWTSREEWPASRHDIVAWCITQRRMRMRHRLRR